MSRAAADRPSRRLDAILTVLEKHRILTFEAAELPGIGTGLKWTCVEAPAVQPEAPNDAPSRSGQMSRFSPRDPAPIDELDIVAEGRDGPLDADEVQ